VTIKQVIVMRKDLNMRKGKMIAQGAHASMSFITRRLNEGCCYHPSASNVMFSKVEQQWLDTSFTKIVVSVDSEEDLLMLDLTARAAGVECHLIQDNGTTEFGGVPTYTCLALGPDLAEKIDPLTKDLKLL
jgi:PTH2 family peptidyl-tRNA hydrolase